ncbi:HlyD family efflux transporter periplasmic adaptor subunit [Agarivorans aestuarii]|uniref:HlyD family efflux transporter periplasmic adaptor subunit n=1 Tax=Agarivorans aestuarii TaxID=1563703 RepID=A0ABU7G6G5_9ALTE|nr:HlyD family efflux transporter periplasmic adaptor subunit [Agarivorans aestuarii]MEE1674754.1 HlyD family efflux transporter periplasmic adaptor subunit [Agarivorans aestuarii]
MKIRFNKAGETKPTEKSGFKVNYAQAKRGGYRVRWYILLALILSPLAILVWFFGKDLAFVRADGILTMNPLIINAPIDGKITELWVNDEQIVNANQALLSFSIATLSAQKALLKDDIAKLEQGLAQINDGVKRNLSSSLLSAQKNLKQHQEFEQEYRQYQEQGLMSLDEVATLQNQYFSAEQGVFKVQQQLSQEQERMLAGPAQQWRNQLRLQVLELQQQIDQRTLTAPYQTKVSEMMVQVGQYVEKGTPLLILAGRNQPEVQVYLPPKYIEYGQLGRTATVTLPNGEDYLAEVLRGTEIAQKIPDILSGPFEGAEPALKVSLSVPKRLKQQIVEGMPVSVRFHYVNRDLNK